MPLTLLEASKLNDGNVLRAGVIETFARTSPVLAYLPFESISGGAFTYNQEQTLPGIGFRGVNQAFAENVGVVNPVTERLVIMGGDLDVDKFLLATRGRAIKAVHVGMKVKAAAKRFTATFINGDTVAGDPLGFDGLARRLVGPNLSDNALGVAGGAPLSLFQLDQAISQVDNPTHLIMSTGMWNRMSQAMRNPAIAGNIIQMPDEFGRPALFYNGLRIIDAGRDDTGADIIDFTETAVGGGAAVTTSIYVVNMDTAGVQGIQNGEIDVRDLGEVPDASVERVRVEWYVGIALMHPRCAQRLSGITNAAVVA